MDEFLKFQEFVQFKYQIQWSLRLKTPPPPFNNSLHFKTGHPAAQLLYFQYICPSILTHVAPGLQFQTIFFWLNGWSENVRTTVQRLNYHYNNMNNMCKFVISGYTLHRQDFDFNVMLAGIDHLNHLPVIKFMQGFHIFHVDFYNISKWVQHNFFGHWIHWIYMVERVYR